jgi:hypothetical protein
MYPAYGANIVRLLAPMRQRIAVAVAATQPQLQPVLLRLSAMISPNTLFASSCLLIVQNGSRCGFAHFKLCAHFRLPTGKWDSWR